MAIQDMATNKKNYKGKYPGRLMQVVKRADRTTDMHITGECGKSRSTKMNKSCEILNEIKPQAYYKIQPDDVQRTKIAHCTGT
jgi:hypothetical protein